MHRFFVAEDQIADQIITIIGTDVNHIKNVLRMKPREEILISSGGNLEYTCYIEEITATAVTAAIMYTQETGLELKSRIYLFQGLPKSGKMELIIQKAVELGAYEIVPVASGRAVVKLDHRKAAAKQKRWQGIAESAAKQARRMIIPEVTKVMSFPEAVAYARELDVTLMPYELATDISRTKAVLNELVPGQSIGVFIGPEGGFTAAEAELARQNEITAITLGKRILRTETAGITMLSILMFLTEEA